MNPKILFLSVLTGFGILSCSVVPKSLHEPVSNSPFIFKGTVEDLNSSTVEVTDTSNLIVVKVDEIISSTKEFDHLKGKTITVETDEVESFDIKQSKVFVSDRWISGNGVAVRNLGDFKVKDQPGSIDKIREKIKSVNEQVQVKNLKELLQKANVVFSGEVMELTSIPSTGRGPLSEHNPEWTEARIQINESMKGLSSSQEEISIIFSNSIDVMWFQAPKFKPKDKGTWILTRQENRSGEAKLSSRNNNLFIISQKEEFTTDSLKLERIKKILK